MGGIKFNPTHTLGVRPGYGYTEVSQNHLKLILLLVLHDVLYARGYILYVNSDLGGTLHDDVFNFFITSSPVTN